MRLRIEFLAIAAIGVVGCGKENGASTSNNSSNPTPAVSNNAPANNSSPDTNVAANNAPADANNAPAATNAPEANNAAPTLKGNGKKPEVTDGKGKPMPPVQASQTAGWTKDAIAAKDLASQVDAKTKTLKDSKIHFHIGARLPAGDGMAQGDMIVADQKRYLLTYAKFLKQGDAHFETYLVTKLPSGSYGTLTGGKYQPGRIDPDGDVLTGWFTDSSHYIASGIGTDKKPLTELIDAAQKAKWKISVESKKFENGSFKRIIMDSPTVPKRRYELMIEPKQLLLTNFNADIDDSKRTQVSVNFDTLKSDHPLTDKDLKPDAPTEKITVLTPEEAKKQGIKVPEPKKKKN